jgi:molybdopterin converting factor small subunit
MPCVTITVYLHTILQKRTADGLIRSLELVVPDGSVVAAVIELLEIRTDLDELLITVNGQVADEKQVLSDGDRVDFIPAISGGFS